MGSPQSAKAARRDAVGGSHSRLLGGERGEDTQAGAIPQVIGYLPKNLRERVRIAFGSYNDHNFLDIRVVVQGPDVEDRPTKQGVTIRPDRIPDLRRLLEAAEDAARERGLL